MIRHQVSFILICLLFHLSSCQEDVAIGEGLVTIEASCDMTISSCTSPPCRFVCPKDCIATNFTGDYTEESAPCRDAQSLFSANNAVDMFKDGNGTYSLISSVHTASVGRRNSEPFCTGDLSLANDASICIVTCSLPDYECPRQFKQRCACPWSKPILKDINKGICVRSIRDCPPYNTYILPKNGLSEFNFTKQPEDLIKKRGDKIRMQCTVNGNTNYQYFWYKSQTLVMGSHSISRSIDGFLQQTGNPYYDINSVQPSDSGYYHCVVRTGDTVAGMRDPKYGSRDAKYSIISNIGYLKVAYLDTPNLGDTVTIVTQKETLKTVLPCDLPKSEPPVEAVWYKGDKVVNDKRMFVVPQAQKAGDKAKRGSLYIIMAETGDAGVYTCKATYGGDTFEVAKVNLEVTGMIGQPISDPEIVVQVAGRARVGQTATFFCAGVGNPVPTVSWSKEDGTRIVESDTVGLSNFNRKLTIANVRPEMTRDFACTVRSENSMNSRKTILYLSIMPSSYQINFQETPSSQIIRPNVYTNFTMRCAITVDPVIEAPVMYWIKNGASLDMKPPSRIRTETTERSVGKVTIRTSKLIFDTPNESDKGVYQCIVENKEQMRQATAYVDVEKGMSYDVYYPQEYNVITNKMKIDEAFEHCTKWKPKGNLVTITNKNESETVFRLLVEAGLTKAWIGLTSETPLRQAGIWKWQAGDHVTDDFSYWYSGNPDNALGNESYAIMDVSRAGHWLDVNNDQTYAFVCSRYTAKCPSVAKFFNNSAKPVSGSLGPAGGAEQEYDVGKVIEVTCVDDARSNVQLKVTCQPNGMFSPSSVPCPVRSRAHHVTGISHVIVGLSLFLLYR